VPPNNVDPAPAVEPQLPEVVLSLIGEGMDAEADGDDEPNNDSFGAPHPDDDAAKLAPNGPAL